MTTFTRGEYLVAFGPGPGVGDEEYLKIVRGAQEGEKSGATREEVLTYLRERHAEEGWADELEYDLYRQQHEWGLAQLALFEQAGMPISMPVRHGAYVVACDVS